MNETGDYANGYTQHDTSDFSPYFFYPAQCRYIDILLNTDDDGGEAIKKKGKPSEKADYLPHHAKHCKHLI